MTIWEYWRYLRDTLEARDYIANSGLFALYERPMAVLMWTLWPWLHIALAAFVTFFIVRIASVAAAFEQYEGQSGPRSGWLVVATLGFALYLVPGTIAGREYHAFTGFQRAYTGIIPHQLPPPPPPYRPGGRILTQSDLLPDRNDTRYWVPPYRANQIAELRGAANRLLTALDFFILLTPLGIAFLVVFLTHWRHFVFALAYDRAVSKPHLPTEIVNRALAGHPVDHRALSRAMTPTTAPITADTIADKVERERLARLAEHLRSDGAALEQKLAREAEIARLVVDHARKREELADMERRLRGMGVKRHD